MIRALRHHWPEYLAEGSGVAMFLVVAGLAVTLMEYPSSPVHRGIASPLARRALVGLAMGSAGAGLIYSPWGRQSGAHLNPAVTLTFWGLGKVRVADAFSYVIAQSLGAAAGVLLVLAALGERFSRPPVHYIVTTPGPAGPLIAFAAEAGMALVLMLTVLWTTNTPRLSHYTGLYVGLLLLLYITVEAPLSGMSLNPARTVGSALPSRVWTAIWVYLLGPLAGMSLAAVLYRAVGREVKCAKLNHHTARRCIFRHCTYREQCHQLGASELGEDGCRFAFEHPQEPRS